LPSISSLASLKLFDVSNNSLSSLPEDIGSLANLERLLVSSKYDPSDLPLLT
jgi:Leucine-rich repeat (LRR) protein